MNTVTFLDQLNEATFQVLGQYTDLMVLVDDHTKEYCYPLVSSHLPAHQVIETPHGEENKTLQTCTQIWQGMTDCALDRKAAVLNLGGGVLGDMGGFCASTYKRGLAFYQMPTTLLSQVDASVGGKLGVDFQGLKNHIGVFNIPENVWIYPGFLTTLPELEVRSGFAEILKHGLIQDKAHWDQARSTNLQDAHWLPLIERSVAIKRNVVESDPTEKGLRKILNFGHTIGHAIETYYLIETNNRLLHREAIAIGMICEAWLSTKLDLLSLDALDEVVAGILAVYGKVALDADQFDYFMQKMEQDKKNVGGTVRFSLLDSIGSCQYDVQVPDQLVRDSFLFYQSV